MYIYLVESAVNLNIGTGINDDVLRFFITWFFVTLSSSYSPVIVIVLILVGGLIVELTPSGISSLQSMSAIRITKRK